MLTFANLRAANRQRQQEWGYGRTIGVGYRANEMAGETGEAIEAAYHLLLQLAVHSGHASNIAKKLEREALGLRGSVATLESLGGELADVVMCVDLLAMHFELDLAQAVIDTFNATSVKRDLAVRLDTIATPPPSLQQAIQVVGDYLTTLRTAGTHPLAQSGELQMASDVLIELQETTP